MADLEKVIRGLECCIVRKHPCGDCVYFVANPNDEDTGWCDRDKIIRNAIELLKAQEPLKPIIEQEMDDVCSDIENIAYCAKCSARLGRVESYKQNYCPNCGQAVKWE